MRSKIDIEKSIEKKKFVPASLYFKIIDYFNYSFFALVFITCIIGPTIGNPIKIDLFKIILIFLILGLLYYVIVTLMKMDHFSSINNHKYICNKNFFLDLAEEKKWRLINEYENVFIFNANQRFSHERQVTIILFNELIFVNVMSLGKYDIKTTLYIRKDKEVLSQIVEKIKKNAT